MTRAGAWLGVAGGLVAAAGSPLPYLTLRFGSLNEAPETLIVWDATVGKVYLAAGIVMLLASVAAMGARSASVPRMAGTVVLIAAAAALAAGAGNVIGFAEDERDAYLAEAAGQLDLPPGQVAEALDEAGVTVSGPGIGVWVSLAGALLGLAGGFLLGGGREAGAPESPAPPQPAG